MPATAGPFLSVIPANAGTHGSDTPVMAHNL
jgi:hypothetical protein